MSDNLANDNVTGLVRGIIDLSTPEGSAGLGTFYLEKWNGTSFLELMLRRIRELRTIDHMVAFTHEGIDPEVSRLLDLYSVQEVVNINYVTPHVDLHPRIIASRKWGYLSWIGCPTNRTIYDEVMPMGLIGYYNEMTKPKTLVCFTPEMPFFDPKIVDNMVTKSGETFEDLTLGMLCMYQPKGISPLVVSSACLKGSSRVAVVLPGQILASDLARYPIKMRSAIGLPRFENDRRDFTLRSKRDLSRLQRWDGKFDALPSTEDFPKEIQLEITSAPQHHNFRLPTLAPTEPMSLTSIEKILDDTSPVEDLLLTVGDLGCLEQYPDLNGLRELLIRKRPYGVHLILDALTMLNDLDSLRAWYESGFDILTLRLNSMGTTKEEMASFDDRVKEIASWMTDLDIPTVFNLELFKHHDNWRMVEKLNEWVKQYKIGFSFTGHNDYAGQSKEEVNLPVYTPRKREACLKLQNQMHILPNGDVTPCRQDFRGLTVLGNTFETSVLDIWKQANLREARTTTKTKPNCATSLCEGCKHWFFV